MIISNPPGPFDPTWESLERYVVPEWYLNAKFGIFIHWGVYTVPAFKYEWYPRHMYKKGTKEFDHHVATFGPHQEFGYKDFIPQFKAEGFSAQSWAELFKEAGAQFVVPVAEHHDGFAMYATKLSKWNAAQMGPTQDVIGELAKAVRKCGMVFGVSSHRAEHWWFMNGGREFPSDVQDPDLQDFYGPAAPEGTQPDEAFLNDWLGRCCELVDKYKPQVFWFDWWIEQPAFAPYLRRFAAYYYNRAMAWGKGVALNYKNDAFPPKAAVFDVERGQLAEIRPQYWQTDTAVAKNSWSNVAVMDYKTVESLIHDLIDIVSKNGCLLLNVGPKADGTFPDEEVRMLREIGDWLSINGEAIFGTRPWTVFGEGPTKVVAGAFKDTERAPFTRQDIRFTKKGEDLYAIILAAEPGEVRIQSLGTNLPLLPAEIASVQLLGHNHPITWIREPDGLVIELPDAPPGRHAVTLRIHPAEGAA